MEKLLLIIHKSGDSKAALVKKLLALKPNEKVSTTHINNWLHRDNKVPPEWVLALSECVNWEITPNDLRPDLYPYPVDGLPLDVREKLAA